MTTQSSQLPRILYICSGARCGSTFLDMLLGGHSRFRSLGEFSFLGKNIALRELCTCGVPVPECPQWRLVFDRVQREKGVNLRESPYALEQWYAVATNVIDRQHQTQLYKLRAKAASAYLLARYRNGVTAPASLPLPPFLSRGVDNALYLYSVIAAEWGADVLVDSSKNLWKALALHEAAPDRVRIILLTRDGRGVFASRRRSGVPPHESVYGWRQYYSRALPALEAHMPPDHLARLRYEDVTAEPEQQLQRACVLIGYPYEPSMIANFDGIRHAVNGNVARFGRSGGIRHDSRWRSDLTADDLAFFERNGGKLNAALGYVD